MPLLFSAAMASNNLANQSLQSYIRTGNEPDLIEELAYTGEVVSSQKFVGTNIGLRCTLNLGSILLTAFLNTCNASGLRYLNEAIAIFQAAGTQLSAKDPGQSVI